MFNRIFQALLVAMFLVIGAAAQSEQPKSEGKTTPVKITKQVRVAYTDEARRADVEGNVALSVVFLATGEIGRTTYIKPDENVAEDQFEKYGLVNESIKAAKQIKFIPASRDGAPITTVKTIVYTFKL